jgi:hypothetical protein
MKTDDLIARLAAEAKPVRPWHYGRAAAVALAAGGLLAALMFALLLGPRPDLWTAMGDPRVPFKTAVPAVLCLLSLLALGREVRPGAPRSLALPSLWAVPVVLVALFGVSFFSTPGVDRFGDFVGHSIHVCLPVIVMMSAPVAAALVLALRKGAPVRQVRTAALAGLAAAGFAAALYSLFCNEDSPLFYVTWYSLAVIAAAGLTAVIGARFLRW